jgi:hypothetical protein
MTGGSTTCSNCGRTVRATGGLCPFCDHSLPKTTRRGANLVMRIAATGGLLKEAPPQLLPDGEKTMLGRHDGPVGDFIARHGEEHFLEVSREHMWVQADGRDVIVYDNASQNGTFVEGKRLTARFETRYQTPITIRLASLIWVRIEVEQPR